MSPKAVDDTGGALMTDSERKVADSPAHRRSSIWVDRGFQSRYALFHAGTAAVIILVLGLLYANVLAEQRELIGIGAMSPGAELTAADRQLDSRFNDMMRSEDGGRLAGLFVIAAALVILLAWVSVRMTFRVVGPVRAASEMLRQIRDGGGGTIRRFRKGDEFDFLAEDIISLRDAVEKRESEYTRLLAESADVLERAGVEPELATRVRALLAVKAQKTQSGGEG